MDDQSFDKSIKQRAEAYQDQGLDSQALSDMRRRLGTLNSGSTKGGWSKSATLATALLLFTLLNLGLVWYFSEGRYTRLETELDALKVERTQLFDALQDELGNTTTQVINDTVYLYREVLVNGSTTAYNQPGAFKPNRSQPWSSQIDNQGSVYSNQYLSLADDEVLDPLLEDFLTQHNLLLADNNGNRFLVVKNNSAYPVQSNQGDYYAGLAPPTLPSKLPGVWDLSMLQTPVESKPQRQLSSKTLWALEKHQFSGLDFQFGFETNLNVAIPELGKGELNASYGLLGEVIFSPAWRLESGIQWGQRVYTLREGDINGLSQQQLAQYPGFDAATGNLVQLKSTSEVLQVPINLKVMGVLDRNKRWYISAGVTPQWLLEQEFDYQYAIDGPNLPGDLDEFRTFIGTRQDVSPGFEAGMINLGVGAEIYLNESMRWQVGTYYQRSLGKIGAENANLQGVGIKTSLWFNKP